MEDKDALVVGAGLSGLACAAHLTAAGLDPLVLEASDGVGGRVRTDVVDGHALPRQLPGFRDRRPESPELRPGLFVCGDHLEDASINGALISGRRAAEAVLGQSPNR